MKKEFMFAAAFLVAAGCQQDPVRTGAGVPQFKVDPFWPKPLPSN